jgi:putative phosphoesterase
MATRVCILSDTHGVVDERVLAEAARCDLVVHGGDIGDGTVLDALHAVCPEVVAVLGNNDLPDKWPVAQHGLLAALPNQARIELPGGILTVEHGHRVNPVATRHHKLRARHPQARAIVYGHSHRLLIDRDAAPWVLNPGAAGRARTHGGASCLLLTAGNRQWRVTPRRFQSR